MATAPAWGALALAATLLTGCDAGSAPSGERPADAATSTQASTPSASTEASPSPAPAATRRLDSIAVLGHSGATGTMSDPRNPSADAHENSWATGENPDVQSIYRRLLADHPAMEGHNYNAAVNGTTVDDLVPQFESLMEYAEVVPDVILIQTIDNDMRCDGTDGDNIKPFGETLDRSLGRMERSIPRVSFFLVSQWATVESWTAWAAHLEAQVSANSGSGPCDVFDAKGRPRPAGIRSMQRIVDAYWRELERVCSRHPRCSTDGGAEQREFVPTDRDVAVDLNHLSIAGHRKFAAIAWKAFPDELKERP